MRFRELSDSDLKLVLRRMIRIGRIEVSKHDAMTGTPTARWDSADQDAFEVMAELSRRTGDGKDGVGDCDLCGRYVAVVAVAQEDEFLAEKVCANCVGKYKEVARS